MELKALSKILSSSYDVIIAQSGEEGLTLAHKNKTDLVLLDLNMPRLSGFEVLSKLKSDEKTKDIPVIFITGSDSDDDELEGLSLGAVDFIRKPFADTIVHMRVGLHMELIEQAKIREFAEKERLANEAKSDFLANMSHEIRTPMNAIIGILRMVQRMDMPSIQREYLDKINFSTKTLLRIVDDILDFSKLEAGMMEIQAVPICLEDIIRGVRGMAEHQAEEKELTFSVEYDPALTGQYLGDPLRLTQVLTNLCANAVKFTEKGSVVIAVKLQATGSTDAALLFSVSDTGIGITTEEQKKLFSVFSQADISATRRYGGTGLGLALCKKLVHLMGGDIWCESEIGKGSTFSFTIRLGTAPDAQGSDPKADTQNMEAEEAALNLLKPYGKSRILLVEDNLVNQFVAEEILKQAGLAVDIANNGIEGLEALNQQEYDLVLMDIQMPKMDGLTASKRIRERDELSWMPIVALTAHVMEEDRRKSCEAGMNAHITKPIDCAVLYRCLSEWLGKGRKAKAMHVSLADL